MSLHNGFYESVINKLINEEITKKYNATFESYWNDNEFYLFNNENANDKLRLKTSLNINKIGSNNTESQFYFDVIPYSYQTEILDKLQAEREIHNRYRNLIVAATGTGKVSQVS